MPGFEIRDPIHKRIPFNAFERTVIDHPFLQRLRFVNQLSFLLSYVYPGATHDRFSHALGAMHVAGRLMGRMKESLEGSALRLGDDTWSELTQVMRLAGLLHDIGHGPFSHASELAFPKLSDLPLNDRWWQGESRPVRQARHEDYSVLLVQALAEESVLSDTMGQDIASLIHGSIEPSPWFEDLELAAPGIHHACKSLISGEVDCDRMDYLLRDSYYCGVTYGHYDLDWLISSLGFAQHDGNLILFISENGVRAFENFLLARYHMFDQVYFHKTVVGFVHYLAEAVAEREVNLHIPGDPQEYAQLRDGKVIEELMAAAQAGKYWSRHLMRRMPAKHILRLQEAKEEDRRKLAGLAELCRRNGIRSFASSSSQALSHMDMTAETRDLYVWRKLVSGHDFLPIQAYSDLLQKYNEKIRFTDFFVLREDAEKFEQVARG